MRRVTDPQETPARPPGPSGGRLQIGMVAGIKSEARPASNRYIRRLRSEFAAKSAEGKLRHPFFKGLREDL
jgi:hypothetical protein